MRKPLSKPKRISPLRNIWIGPGGNEGYMPQGDLARFLKFVNDISTQCIHLQLILSIDQIGRIKDSTHRAVKYGQVRSFL